MTSEEYPFDLGQCCRSVTSTSALAQTWFNRGLLWAYAFNHEESAWCFEQAILCDPACAMAYWGLAYSLGPNYNKPWGFFDETDLAEVVHRGHEASIKAQEVATPDIAPVERALIQAVIHRYPKDTPSDDCSSWSQGFADAMEAVNREFPDDLDVITLYADALMNLNPWNLWSLKTGEPIDGARTLEIKALLDHALTLDGALKHPGLLHMYIHLMEMSPSPESALPIANHLRGLVPDGGHLQHMPTHLDVLCGQYQAAIDSNSDAIVADDKFLARAGPLNFYTLYRAHDMHFRVYAAMFAGQFQVSLDTVAHLESTIPKSLLEVQSPPMADWLEGFLSLRAHVLIRFGRWRDLIQLDLPQYPELYSTTTAIVLYAKGVAFAATGKVEEAEIHRQLFRRAVSQVQPTRTLFNNKCLDILQVAAAMLDGELEYRRENYEIAFEHLREAIKREDSLPYDEPWGWMQPTRHAYGALLLERGHVKEALEVYEADLGMSETLPRALRHPNNIWALHGVHECLAKLGRASETNEVVERLEAAKGAADVPINASCYCRRERSDRKDGAVTSDLHS